MPSECFWLAEGPRYAVASGILCSFHRSLSPAQDPVPVPEPRSPSAEAEKLGAPRQAQRTRELAIYLWPQDNVMAIQQRQVA